MNKFKLICLLLILGFYAQNNFEQIREVDNGIFVKFPTKLIYQINDNVSTI